MKEPVLSLLELSATIPLAPEGVDTATALIADVAPQTLNAAVDTTLLEASRASYRANGGETRHAEAALEASIMYPEFPIYNQGVRARLETALARQYTAAEDCAVLLPDAELAEDIVTRKSQLSRPMRWLTALSMTATFGGGVTYALYDAVHASNRQAITITEQANERFPQYTQPLPSEALDSGQMEVVAIVGVAASAVGAAGGTYLGARLSEGVAQARAKRIVRKASK